MNREEDVDPKGSSLGKPAAVNDFIGTSLQQFIARGEAPKGLLEISVMLIIRVRIKCDIVLKIDTSTTVSMCAVITNLEISYAIIPLQDLSVSGRLHPQLFATERI